MDFRYFIIIIYVIILCSCSLKKGVGSMSNIDQGYSVACDYSEDNYDWNEEDYFITYKFIFDELLVYDVTYKESPVVVGTGKSISIFLDTDSLDVVKVLKAQ